MRYPLPGLDVGGFRGFPYRLARDRKGQMVLLHNDVMKMYLGYCAQCRLQKADPAPFHDWIYSPSDLSTTSGESANG